jgi:hypothetical protein
MPKAHELNLESAQAQPDETLLADEADIEASENEMSFLTESRGTLVPFGWDYA